MDPIKKSRGRRKILFCFRPAVVDNGSEFPGSDAGSDDEASRRRKKKPRRTFSGVFKALLFEITLAKKIQSKKARQSSSRSSSISSYTTERFSDASKKKNSALRNMTDPEEIFRTDSSRSSLFSSSGSSAGTSSLSSSCTSSIASNSRSSSERKPQAGAGFIDPKLLSINKQGKKRGCPVTYVDVCMLLVSLFALVVWGKVSAIFTCTSTWLLFARRRWPAVDSPAHGDVDSDEYKKRVVLEGLLDRNNRTRL